MAVTVATVKQNKGSLGTGIVVVRTDQDCTIRPNGITDATNVGANTATEVVNSMNIAAVTWQNTGGNWTIDRGADEVMVLEGYGHLNFAEDQMRVETAAQETANCVITRTGTSGILLIKFHKRSGE